MDAGDPQAQARIVAFRQGMEERGWSEGRNLQIDYQLAGDAERIKSYAAELVSARPDVIFAGGSASVAALQQATRAIPIVFAGIGDPVGQGLFKAWRGRAAISRDLPRLSSLSQKSGSSFSRNWRRASPGRLFFSTRKSDQCIRIS
jgi:hypothetical protein